MNYLVADSIDLNSIEDQIASNLIHIRRSDKIKLAYKILTIPFLLMVCICLFIQFPQSESQTNKWLIEHSAAWPIRVATALFWSFMAILSHQMSFNSEFFLDLAERKYQFRKNIRRLGSWKTTHEGTSADMIRLTIREYQFQGLKYAIWLDWKYRYLPKVAILTTSNAVVAQKYLEIFSEALDIPSTGIK